MLNNIYKLQNTIDVFITQTEVEEKVKLTFHKMTTRERIELIAGKPVAQFLALLDGKKSTLEILALLGNFKENEAIKLVEFLISQHLIFNLSEEGTEQSPRFSRQIAYFDDMILDRRGFLTQDLLAVKKVVILGCGAINSAIAENLVRAGVLNFVLVDYKDIDESTLDRHLFARIQDIGKPKVEVLASYLKRIDKNVKITTFKEWLFPQTDLLKWVDERTNLVINSCDEPYIGHTSLKVGRFAQSKNIALYVAGGFDAHLMSSGELILPPLTPCIDCAQQTFTTALGDWKPTYGKTVSLEKVSNVEKEAGSIEQMKKLQEEAQSYQIGGAGGLAPMSGFSAHLSSLKIIQFLAQDSKYDYKTIRYEYLPNEGEFTAFEMLKQEGCHVCNK